MILVTERSLIYMCIGNLGLAKSSHLTICAVHVNQVWKVCRPLIHVGFGKSRFFVQTRDCHTRIATRMVTEIFPIEERQT